MKSVIRKLHSKTTLCHSSCLKASPFFFLYCVGLYSCHHMALTQSCSRAHLTAVQIARLKAMGRVNQESKENNTMNYVLNLTRRTNYIINHNTDTSESRHTLKYSLAYKETKRKGHVTCEDSADDIWASLKGSTSSTRKKKPFHCLHMLLIQQHENNVTW